MRVVVRQGFYCTWMNCKMLSSLFFQNVLVRDFFLYNEHFVHVVFIVLLKVVCVHHPSFRSYAWTGPTLC